MPESSNTISTATLMKMLIKDTFGSYIITKEKMCLPDSSKEIGSRTFFVDRLRIQPDRPIGGRAAEYVMTIYKLALNGKTQFNQFETSDKLAWTISVASGRDLAKTAIKDNEAKHLIDIKTRIQLSHLKTLLTLANNAESVFVPEYANSLDELMRGRETRSSKTNNAKTDHQTTSELKFLPDSVTEADFSKRIADTERTLDVVFVHGTNWFRQCKESIMSRLMKGGLKIRVSLMDPMSPFTIPYAILKEGNRKESRRVVEMISKIDKSRIAWENLIAEAIERGADDVSLEIYYSRLTPAQCFYRFDQAILVCPTRNTNEFGVFPAIECVNTGYPDSAYNTFLNEIEAVFKSGKQVFRLSITQRIWRTARRSSDFLKNLLTTCFETTSFDFSEWTPMRGVEWPDPDYFAERIKTSSKPIDTETAKRLLEIFEAALMGNCPIEPITIVKRYTEFMRDVHNIEIQGCDFSPNDTRLVRRAKCRWLIDSLFFVLDTAIDKEGFDPSEARKIISMTSFDTKVLANLNTTDGN